MPDKETADRQAARFSQSWASYRKKWIAENPDYPSIDYFSDVEARVIPWPLEYWRHSEGNASALAWLASVISGEIS